VVVSIKTGRCHASLWHVVASVVRTGYCRYCRCCCCPTTPSWVMDG